MKTDELICIGCPMGCMLTVETSDDGTMTVTGNTCKNGEIYAKKELTNPTRIVTSTVKVNGGKGPVVSCKTKSDIPKDIIFDCMKEIKNASVDAPVSIGDVLISNVLGSGADVIATSNMDIQGDTKWQNM